MSGNILFSVLSDLEAATWQEAVTLLVNASGVIDKDAAIKAVIERESEGSTAIGDGVAVPHARLDGIDSILAVVGRSRSGVRMGDERVHIFLLLLIPRFAGTSHVDFLSHAVRILSSPANRERIMTSHSDDEILEVFDI